MNPKSARLLRCFPVFFLSLAVFQIPGKSRAAENLLSAGESLTAKKKGGAQTDGTGETAPATAPAAPPEPFWGWFARGKDTGFETAVRSGTNVGNDKAPPRVKGDPLSVLRHISLSSDGAFWLAISGESRLRNWFHSRPMLNGFGGGGTAQRWNADKGEYVKVRSKGHNDAGRFYARNLLSADLHMGPHLRLFTQLINADAGGVKPYFYSAFWKKDLDLQQAFLELGGRAPRTIGGRGGFIVGRQEFMDGPDYLISTREVPTMPQSWNGFRLYHFWDRVRIDAYNFTATDDHEPNGKNNFFNDTYPKRILGYHKGEPGASASRLYGFNATLAFPFKGHGLGMLDMFYLGFMQNGGGLDGNSSAATYMDPRHGSMRIPGSDARNDFGFRWHGHYDDLIFSTGFIYQEGTFHEKAGSFCHLAGYAPGGINNAGCIGQNLPGLPDIGNGYVPSGVNRRRHISAWSANSTLGWRFEKRHSMILGVQQDIYSGGGGNSRTGTIHTYIAPNINLGPNPMYLDPTASLIGSNVVGVTPFYSVSAIPKRLSFKVAGAVFWRYSKQDGMYAYLMSGLHTLKPWKGSYMGFVPRLEASAVICPHVHWTGFVARWMTGNQFSKAGASSTTAAQSNIFFDF